MDRITVVPLKQFGPVLFGCNRDEVRKALGNYTEFRKSSFSDNTTDDFGFCHVYYDKNNMCEAVEFFDNCKVEIHGNIVFPDTMDKASEIIGKFEEIDGSFINIEKSVGITIINGKMESILFGKQDYYSWLND